MPRAKTLAGMHIEIVVIEARAERELTLRQAAGFTMLPELPGPRRRATLIVDVQDNRPVRIAIGIAAPVNSRG